MSGFLRRISVVLLVIAACFAGVRIYAAGTSSSSYYYTLYDDGAKIAAVPHSWAIGTVTKLSSTPYKPGYSFAGYYTGRGCNGTQIIDYTGTVRFSLGESTTLYACWLPYYPPSIVFDDAGGSGGHVANVNCFGLLDNILVTGNHGVYHNGDWADVEKADRNGDWLFNSMVVNKSNQYYWGHVCDYGSITTMVPPTRSGYTFKGYYTGQNGSGTQVVYQDGTLVDAATVRSALSTTEPTTVYAYWIVDHSGNYSITLDDAGGSGGQVASSPFFGLFEIYGECYASASSQLSNGNLQNASCLETIYAAPTKTGYNFGGYYTGQDGSGVPIINSSRQIDQTKSTQFTAPGTIHAKWTPKVLTVTLNHNGATNNPTPSTVYLKYATGWYSNAAATSSYSITSMTKPEKTNYTFAGYWTTNASSGGVRIIDADGHFETTSAALRAFSENGTAYARWVANSSNPTPIWVTVNIYDELGNVSGATHSSPTVLYRNTNMSVSNCSGYKATQSCNAATVTSIIPATKPNYTYGGHWTATGGSGTPWTNANGTILYNVTADTDVYAKWTLDTGTVRTITLDKNGGSDDLEIYEKYNVGWFRDSNGSYQITSSIFKPETSGGAGLTKPTRDRYGFAGYYTATSGGDQIIDGDGNIRGEPEYNANTILYAQWYKNSKVVLDPNGGTQCSVRTVTATYGASMPELTCEPTYDGYIFIGYFDDPSAGNQYYTDELQSARNWDKTGTTETLYAHWMAVPTYDIVYYCDKTDVESGIPNYRDTGIYTGQDYMFKTRAAVGCSALSGKKFLGWGDDNNGTGTTVFYQPGQVAQYPYQHDARLVAYNMDIATVTLDHGSPDNTPSPSTVYYVQTDAWYTDSDATNEISTMTTVPVKYGYDFVGYYTAENGSGVQIIDENGEFINHSYVPLGDLNFTLYAHYSAKQYPFTLNDASATTASAPNPVTYKVGVGWTNTSGTTITSITKPTKTGNSFAGFWTGPNGSGTKIINADGTFVPMTSEILRQFDSGVDTLYAKWNPKYTVTFSCQNQAGDGSGTPNPATVQVADGETFTFPAMTNCSWGNAGMSPYMWGVVSGNTFTDTHDAGDTITYDSSWGNRTYNMWYAPNYFNYEYSCDAGTGTPPASGNTYYHNGGWTTAANTCTPPANKHFAGWLEPVSGVPYAENTTPTGGGWIWPYDVTFVAQWELNTFNVVYANGGGSGNAPAPTTCTSGQACNAAANTYTAPTGKIFNGWACTASSGNCASASYAAGESIAGATNVNGATITLTAQWITPPTANFTVTTTNLAANTTFTFNMSAAGDFYVNWGDGTIEHITNVDATARAYSHTYTSAGVKTIGFSGQATSYDSSYASIRFGTGQYNGVTEPTATLVAGVSGSIGSVFPTLGQGDTLTPSFYDLFLGCSNLTGAIPATFFNGVTGARSNMFRQTFRDTGITSIPANLFSGVSGAEDYMFAGTFSETNISSIPAGLFNGVSGHAERLFYATFANCVNLSSIPTGLFSNVSGADEGMFAYTFAESGLTGNAIPATLFSGVSGAADFMFNATFQHTGITTIPATLFSGVSGTADYMFSQTFSSCASLTGYIPSTLFRNVVYNANNSMMYQIFLDTGLATSCDSYGLTQYPTGFESYWNGKVSCAPAALFTCVNPSPNMGGSGTITSSPIFVEPGEAFTFPASTGCVAPTHYNMTDFSWTCDEAMCNNGYRYWAGNTAMDGGWPVNQTTSVQFYAHYQGDVYTVTLNPGTGGVAGTLSAVYEKYNSGKWSQSSAEGPFAAWTALTTGQMASRLGYDLTGYWSQDGNTKYINADGTLADGIGSRTFGANTTIYAGWTPKTYTIGYTLNGGTAGTNAPTSAAYDSVVNISNPTHARATFTGWTITGMDNGVTHYYGTGNPPTSTTTATSITTPTKATYYKNLHSNGGTVTFTAVWECDNGYVWNQTTGTCDEPLYTAHFTCENNVYSPYVFSGTAYADMTGIAYQQTITLPSPSVCTNNYPDTGWIESPATQWSYACTGETGGGSAPAGSWTWPKRGDCTFRPLGSTNVYHVNYYCNDTTTAVSLDETVDYTNRDTVRPATVSAAGCTVPTGHHFAGWKVGGTDTILQPGQYGGNNALWPYAQTVNLRAQWEPDTYNLTWSCGNGTGTPSGAAFPTTINYGDTLEFPANTACTVPTGYTFAGWVIEQDPTSGTHEAGDEYEWNMVLGSEIIAAYDPIKVNITYSCGTGATGTVPAAQNNIDYGSSVTLRGLGNCAKAGHTATKWVVSNTSPAASYNFGATVNPWNYTENKTLTPNWSAQSYSIKYYDEDGTTEFTGLTPTQYTYGTTTTINAVPPAKLHSVFSGWCTARASDGTLSGCQPTTNPHVIGATETGAKTYYASWSCEEGYRKYEYTTFSNEYGGTHGDFPAGTCAPVRYKVTCNGNGGVACLEQFNFTRSGTVGQYSLGSVYNASVINNDGNWMAGLPVPIHNDGDTVPAEHFVFTKNPDANYSLTNPWPGTLGVDLGWTSGNYLTFMQTLANESYNNGINFGRPHYTFDGLWTQANGGQKYIGADGMSPTGGAAFATQEMANFFTSDAQVYAHWKPDVYTILLEAQGYDGTLSAVYETYNTGWSQTLAGTPGEWVQLTAAQMASKPGYTLLGYYSTASGTGTKYINGDGTLASGVTPTTFGESTTLHARWQANTYNVTYECNGASGGPRTYNNDATFGTNYNPKTPATVGCGSYPGHTFSHWTVSGDSSNNAVPGTPFTWNYTENKTFTAQWSDDTYTITFHPGDNVTTTGTTEIWEWYSHAYRHPSNGSQSWVHIEEIELPTKTGYTFAGYYDNPSFTGTPVMVDATLPVTTPSATYFTADADLYAKWTKTGYTVTYKNGGGTGSDVVQDVTYDTQFTTKPGSIFTKTNYVVTKWNTTSGGTYPNLNSGYTYSTAGNTVLTANWGACTCTKGTHVTSCNVTGVENNTCQYSYTCEAGYNNAGATSGTFNGTENTAANTSPNCGGANSYTITVTAGNGISKVAASGWTNSGTTTMTKTFDFGDTIDLSTVVTATRKVGYTGVKYENTSGAGSISGNVYTVGAGNGTITVSAVGIAGPVIALGDDTTKVYNYQATTLTTSNSTQYDTGITLRYTFGYSNSADGVYNWNTESNSNTLSIAKNEFLGTRYYKVMVSATDGVITSGTGVSNVVAVTLDQKKITFDATTNGGTLSGTSPLYVRYDSANVYTGATSGTTGTVPTATKTGYEFKGWYTEQTGGSQIYNASGTLTSATVPEYTGSSKWQTTANRTLYAQFSANTNTPYKVYHYIKNLTGTGYTLNGAVDNLTGTSNASVTLSVLARALPGFTYDAGFETTISNGTHGTTKPSSGAVTTTTILPDGTRIIDLYYNRNSYTITYKNGGGVGADVTQPGISYMGSFKTKPGTTFTKTNSIMTGWDTTSGGNYPLLDHTYSEYDTAGNTVLTAAWATCGCTAGTGVASCTTSATATNTCAATVTCASGYDQSTATWSCSGASCSSSCSADDYEITLDNANATTNGTAKIYTTYDVNVYLDAGRGTVMTLSTNPITKPERVYTVTYNGNNGTVGTTTAANTTATYTFKGYYSAATNGTRYIVGSTGHITQDGITAGKGYSANATWYAQWTSASVTLPNATRAGYTFAGWYDKATGGNPIGAAGATYTPTEDKTLYAHWDECTAGNYCDGTGTVTSCSTATNGKYPYSEAGASSINDCYLTTTAGKYVATAGAGEVQCVANDYCAGGVNVYYGGTHSTTHPTKGGNASCSSGTDNKYNYSAAGTSTVDNCYLTLTTGKYVATVGAGMTNCAANNYSDDTTTKVYYGGTASSTHPTTSSCAACSTLGGGLYTRSAVGSGSTGCYVTTTAGKYIIANTDTAQTTCPAKKYCESVPIYWPNVGQIADCPVADATTAMTSYPSNYYNPTRLTISNQGWSTGLTSISACMANYTFSNARGNFTVESVKYNTTTGKYDNGGSKYYRKINAGYYGNERYSATYCNTATNSMIYKDALPCPADSYCPGLTSMPLCSSGTYNETIGLYSCPTNYPDSAAMSTSINACYLTTTAGKYVASAGDGEVQCTANNYCTGGVVVHYDETGGITACSTGAGSNYATSAAGSDSNTDCYKTVTLDKNGGSGTIQGTSGTNPASVVCHYNTECNFGSASDLVQNGYTFSGGWGTTNTCSGATFKFTVPNDTGTYYACKSADCNEITVDNTTRGGTTANTKLYKKSGDTKWYSDSSCQTAKTTTPRPTKTNATFSGYYTSATNTTTQVGTNANPSVLSTTWTVTGPATIYAHYNCDSGWQEAGTDIAGTCIGTITATASNKSLTYNGTSTTNGTAQSCANVTVTSPSGTATSYAFANNGSCSGVTYGSDVTMTNVSEGTKTVCYKVTKTNYADKTGKYTCTMNAATPSYTKTNKTKVYDGTALSCDGVSLTGTGNKPTNGTIKYSNSQNGTYTATVPTQTNVGSQTVWFKVSGTNFTETAADSFTCSVTAATMNPTPSNNSKTYDGTALSCNGNTWSGVPAGSTKYYSTDGGDTYNTTVPTRTAAGTTTVNWKVTNPNYADKTGTFTCTVNAGTINATASDMVLTYNGTNGNNGTAQSCANVTVTTPDSGANVTYATKTGAACGSYGDAPTLTNVNDGPKTICYKVTATNYETLTGEYTCSMNKADGNVVLSATSGTTVYPNTKTFTVTTNKSGGTLSASPTSGNVVATASVSGTTVTATPKKTGTQTITVTSAATNNYNAATATYDLTVTDGGITHDVSDVNKVYDGTPLVCNGVTNVVPTGAEVKYRTTTSGAYNLTSAPSITNVADSKTIYYQITKDNYEPVTGQFNCTVTKADCPITVKEGNTTLTSSSVVTLTYPTSKTLTATSSCGNAVTISSGDTAYITVSDKTLNPVKVTSSNITMAATVAASANYNSATASFKAKVNRGTCSITLNPTSGSGTCASNTATFTIDKGSCNGTVTASSSDTNIATVALNSAKTQGTVTRVSAGNATITVNVAQTNQYNATSAEYTFSGNKVAGSTTIKDGTATVSSGSVVYPDVKTLNVTCAGNATPAISNAGTTTVATVTLSNGTITMTPKKTGTSTITVSCPATDCYDASSATYKLTVNPADFTVTEPTNHLTYNGTATNNGTPQTCPAIAVSGLVGDQTATIKYGTASGTYNSSTPRSITNAGDVTVYYQVTASNHNTQTGEYTCTMDPRTSVASASDKALTYNGSAQSCANVTLTYPTNGTIKWKTSASASYGTTEPMMTDVSESPKTIYYQVSGANFTTITDQYQCTMAKAAGAVTVSQTSMELPYSGTGTFAATCNSGSAPTITTNGNTTGTWANGTVTVNASSTYEVAKLTVNCAATTNYTAASKDVTVTVDLGTIALNDAQNGGANGSETIYTKYNTAVYRNSGRTETMSTNAYPVTIPTKTKAVFTGYYDASNGTKQYIAHTGYITSGTNGNGGINAGKALNQNGTWYAKFENCTCDTSDVGVNTCVASGVTNNQCVYDVTFNPGYTGAAIQTNPNPGVGAYTAVSGVSVYTITLRNYNDTATHSTIYEKYGDGWYREAAATNSITAATLPTRSGYKFRGFYTAKQDDLTQSGGSGVRRITNALTYNLPNATTFTANTPLYAAWAKECTAPVHGTCDVVINSDGTATYSASCDDGYTVSGATTATPTCTPNIITLNFVSEHGTSPAARTCTYGSTFNMPAAITGVVGYTFHSWNVNSNDFGANETGVACDNATLGVTSGSVTINATWKNNYYLILLDDNGGNGGQVAENSTWGMYERYNDSYRTAQVLNTVDLDASVLLEYIYRAPTKQGYTFTGYYTENGEQVIAANKRVVGSPTLFEQNDTIYAHWTANTGVQYKVYHYTKDLGADTYTLNGAVDTLYGVADSTVTLADLARTITGFTYDSGFETTASNGTHGTTKPSSGAVTTTTILPDGTRVIDLYYNRDKHTVTLTKGTGIATVTGAGTYEYGASVSINATMNNGYDWYRWTNTNTDAVVTTTKAYPFTMGTADIAYTANAKVHSYTITYDLNQGTSSTTPEHGTNHPETYKVTDATFTISNPTMTGYTFAGWTVTTAPEGWGSGSSTSGSTNFKVGSGTYGNIAFRATWTANRYSIAYTLNGGAYGASHPVSATFDAQFTVNNPTHEHATFTGWNISSMDTTTHTYGNESDSLREKTGVTATTFKNLRATAGTVTFTATWNCDTGYAGTNCDAIDYNMQYVCGDNKPGWNFEGSAPVATNPVHYGQQDVQLAGDIYAELDGCRKVWGSPNDANYCDNCFTFGGWTIDAESTALADPDITHDANSTVDLWGRTNTTDWCIISDTGNCEGFADDIFYVAPVYIPKQYNIEYMYATGPVSGASANMPASYTYTTETTISNADQTAPAHATFNGWCTGANGTGTCFDAGQSITIGNRDHGDMRYYANWSCETGYTLTYDANNQPVCSADAITCLAGFYLPANSTTCEPCLTNYYCTGGTWAYDGEVKGLTQCPIPADHKRTTFPSNYYTFVGWISTGYANSAPTASGGYRSVTQCQVINWLEFNRGKLYEYVRYNETSGKYDNNTGSWGWSDVKPGYYLTTKSACGAYAYYHDALECVAGGYCPGKTRVACNSSNSATVHTTTFGLEVCADNTYSNVGAAQCTACLTANGYQNSGDEFADHAYESSCKTTCAVGQCVATARAACANVGTTGWATGGNVSQGDTLACNVCPTGEMTIGYGVGANESGDCGRVLHVGDSQLYLRSDRKTDKTLNFKIGTKIYYANMSTDNIGMSHGATKALKLRFNNTTYSAYDDSALE